MSARLPTQRRDVTRGRGVTLPEILISMAIGVLILGVVTALYVSAHRLHKAGSQAIDTQQQVLITLDRLSREVRMARILSPSPSQTGTILEYRPPNLLNEKYPIVDTSDTITFDTTIKYRLTLVPGSGGEQRLMKIRYRNTGTEASPIWVQEETARVVDLGVSGAVQFTMSDVLQRTLAMHVTARNAGGEPFAAETKVHLWNH